MSERSHSNEWAAGPAAGRSAISARARSTESAISCCARSCASASISSISSSLASGGSGGGSKRRGAAGSCM